MKYRVFKPDNLSAEVLLPASKSISNRALLLTALSGGSLSRLANVSDCDDTHAMLRALALLDDERHAPHQIGCTRCMEVGSHGRSYGQRRQHCA